MNKFLNNLTLGNPQIVGQMTVIPLLGEDVNEEVGSINEVNFQRTVYTYGNMEFQNDSQFPVILPSGYTVLTKQAAQDHSLPFAGMLPPNQSKVFENACCVESSQGGLIDGNKTEEFFILPFDLRVKHFKKFVLNERTNHSNLDFSRMWDMITEFQGRLVKEDRAHLSFFFTKFMQELNRFNAEFETVSNQRGAIILYNGELLGVEVLPTQKDWKVVWQKLIRDCYGSEIIRRSKLNLPNSFQKHQNEKVDFSSCQNIQELEELLHSNKEKIKTNTFEKLEELLSLERKEHKNYKNLKLEDNNTEKITYSLSSSNNGKNLFEAFETQNETIYLSLLVS